MTRSGYQIEVEFRVVGVFRLAVEVAKFRPTVVTLPLRLWEALVQP